MLINWIIIIQTEKNQTEGNSISQMPQVLQQIHKENTVIDWKKLIDTDFYKIVKTKVESRGWTLKEILSY